MLYVSQGSDITDEKVCAVANKLLENSHHSIENLNDLKQIRDELIASRYLKIDENERYVPKIRIQRYTFNGDKQVQRVLDALNGKVLHLYLLKLQQEANEYYEVEYNVDGNGEIKLPTKEIVHKKLTNLASDVLEKKSVSRGALGPSSWFLVKEKHHEIKKRGRCSLQDYIDNYL